MRKECKVLLGKCLYVRLRCVDVDWPAFRNSCVQTVKALIRHLIGVLPMPRQITILLSSNPGRHFLLAFTCNLGSNENCGITLDCTSYNSRTHVNSSLQFPVSRQLQILPIYRDISLKECRILLRFAPFRHIRFLLFRFPPLWGRLCGPGKARAFLVPWCGFCPRSFFFWIFAIVCFRTTTTHCFGVQLVTSKTRY